MTFAAQTSNLPQTFMSTSQNTDAWTNAKTACEEESGAFPVRAANTFSTSNRARPDVFDAIILSDLHPGSSNCQAKSLCSFLEQIVDEKIATAKLILNGDVFDSIDFRRLNKNHWKVLSLLRKLSDRIEIIWLSGNHDGSADIISHLLGVTVKDEYVLESGGQKVLILHGHRFDDFIDAHPILTWLGDCVYFLLQWIDRTHSFAKLAKKGSKTFLRCAKKIEEGALEYARRIGCSVVCCGHTHHAGFGRSPEVLYYNSGCWTEVPCTFLTVAGGEVQLHQFQTSEMPEHVEESANLLLAS
jgi:UDP-2,3-diacylglucosamine pyrophosphatase LpxH